MNAVDNEQLKWARDLFGMFKQIYDRQTSDSVWRAVTIGIPDERRNNQDERTGLNPQEQKSAAKLLTLKHLIEPHTTQSYRLTEQGKQVCLHPELLDEALGPPKAATSVNNTTTIGAIHGNPQVGNNNVQNNLLVINNIQQLVQEISNDPDVDPEKKSRWIEKLVDMATNIGGAAAGAAVSKMIGG